MLNFSVRNGQRFIHDSIIAIYKNKIKKNSRHNKEICYVTYHKARYLAQKIRREMGLSADWVSGAFWGLCVAGLLVFAVL